MQEKSGINLVEISPKAVLRQALKANIITLEELNILLNSMEHRNLTSHSYNERVAEEINQNILLSYQTMTTITNRLTV